jgi:hypothetical protein
MLTLVASTGIAMADDETTEGSCAPVETCPPAAQAEPMQPQPTQPMTEPQPSYEPAPAPTPEQAAMGWASKYGVEVALGGGVEGFTNNIAQNATDTGGGWNVKLGIGNTQVLGFEALYFGSAQGINALGLDTNAVLVGNGIQGNVRVNFMPDYTIKPFGYAGAAWRHYNLANTDFNTSDIADSDDVLEIPLGGGVAATYRGFLFDARGEFRIAAAGDSLIPDLTVNNNNDAAGLDRWGFNANVGYQF